MLIEVVAKAKEPAMAVQSTRAKELVMELAVFVDCARQADLTFLSSFFSTFSFPSALSSPFPSTFFLLRESTHFSGQVLITCQVRLQLA